MLKGNMSGKPKRTGSSNNSFNMWVSTNKVLIGSVGGAKKQHSRNPNFECEETRLLITLWGDPQVQTALATTHKKQPVIAKLAEKMKEYGYTRSTEEVNTRIKNLKCIYNRIKKDMETGIVTSWKHFAALDKIMTRQQNTDSEAGSSSTKISTDQVEVKIETLSDDDKDIRTEELLKNAEQVELKEPNLLIPKDEPMDQDNDEDPNDPDFENDGDDEEDSYSNNDSDESDFDIDNERRKARLRRRASRKTKPKLNVNKKITSSTTVTSTTTTTTVTTASVITPTVAPTSTPAQNTIKIINYTGNSGLNISKIVSNANVIQPTSAQNVAIVSATPNTTTTSTAGKISLVPTNFLLKPQPPKINFNSPIQLYTKPTVSVSTSGTPVGSVPSSQSTVQPMKLLLVNTANGQNQQIQIPAGKQIYTTTTTPIVKATQATQISIQPKPVITSAGSLMAIPQKKPDPPPTSTSITVTPAQPKQTGGLRNILSQLVALQKESLAVSRNRMNVEKERLSNEKHIACSLVEALNDLNNMLHNYSSMVNIGGDEYGPSSTSHQQRNSNAGDSSRDSSMNDINQQDIPPVGNLIPVIDTIKAEVISDSD